jgi:hypothetical protein
MSYFLKTGNTFRVAPDGAIDLHHTLPVGNYIIKVDPMGNLYLEEIDSFVFSGKRYGDNIRHTDRIMNTFIARDTSTGVMLAGEKGSGKSILAKSLSMAAAKYGVPTIVINSPFKGDAFNKLIQDISQPCVILFDEFEKVYDKEDQEAILTLLDGVFPSKKLFILTCNDKYRIDTHMRNRPGRIYYMIDFKGLDTAFITEYCNDNLENKSYISKICSIASLFDKFNFDMLKALIEEMNRYDESPQQSLQMLNAKPEFDGGGSYSTILEVNGKIVHPDNRNYSDFNGNPLAPSPFMVDYDTDPDDEKAPWASVEFDQSCLHKLDATSGVFQFMHPNGAKFTLTKIIPKHFNFDAF